MIPVETIKMNADLVGTKVVMVIVGFTYEGTGNGSEFGCDAQTVGTHCSGDHRQADGEETDRCDFVAMSELVNRLAPALEFVST